MLALCNVIKFSFQVEKLPGTFESKIYQIRIQDLGHIY